MFDESAFLARLEAGHLQLGVIGLGYVGLPLALTFVERTNLRVLGFDIDEARIHSLEAGRSYICYLPDARVNAARATGRFEATLELSRLDEPDVLIIAVPTPLDVSREPDLCYLRRAAESVSARLRAGQLVIVESTTYPGTTEEFILPILERGGLRCGTDFLLAYSPEREDPGNPSYGTSSIPKLLGGLDATTTRVAQAFYAKAIDRIVAVASPRVAEAAKLTENVFRAVNIALVNELKIAYDHMGLDVWEVLDAAGTKPFGFMRFNPGPGLGGHCIPIDPLYLSWAAKHNGGRTRLIDTATQINRELPAYVVQKLRAALLQRQSTMEGCRVLVLGVAYKRDIDDPRESPAIALIELLCQAQAVVSYHDPLVPQLSPRQSQPLTPTLLAEHDAVIIVTDHSSIDYAMVLKHARLIVDPRGVFREPQDHVIKA